MSLSPLKDTQPLPEGRKRIYLAQDLLGPEEGQVNRSLSLLYLLDEGVVVESARCRSGKPLLVHDPSMALWCW